MKAAALDALLGIALLRVNVATMGPWQEDCILLGYAFGCPLRVSRRPHAPLLSRSAKCHRRTSRCSMVG